MWVFIFVYLIVNAGEDRALPIVTTENLTSSIDTTAAPTLTGRPSLTVAN